MPLSSWNRRHRMSWSGLVWASSLIWKCASLTKNRQKSKIKEEEKGGGGVQLVNSTAAALYCSMHPMGRSGTEDVGKTSSDNPGFKLVLVKISTNQSLWCVSQAPRCYLRSPVGSMCAQSRRVRAYVECSLHSTALLWIHLRMAADSVQWTSSPEFRKYRSLLWGGDELIGWACVKWAGLSVYSKHRFIRKFIILFPVAQEGAFFKRPVCGSWWEF